MLCIGNFAFTFIQFLCYSIGIFALLNNFVKLPNLIRVLASWMDGSTKGRIDGKMDGQILSKFYRTLSSLGLML